MCPEKGLLFISVQDAGRVHMYRTISRDNPGTPVLLQEIDAGHLPDVLLPNSDCSVLAVTNENEGDALNQGAIHLVSNFEQNGKATVKSVKFDGFTDDYLLSRNVHMPLTYNAMIYWDLHSNIADDVDWTEVLADYNPGLFLEPEFMAFTEDGSQLLVNLQENVSAMSCCAILCVSNPQTISHIFQYGSACLALTLAVTHDYYTSRPLHVLALSTHHMTHTHTHTHLFCVVRSSSD